MDLILATAVTKTSRGILVTLTSVFLFRLHSLSFFSFFLPALFRAIFSFFLGSYRVFFCLPIILGSFFLFLFFSFALIGLFFRPILGSFCLPILGVFFFLPILGFFFFLPILGLMRLFCRAFFYGGHYCAPPYIYILYVCVYVKVKRNGVLFVLCLCETDDE